MDLVELADPVQPAIYKKDIGPNLRAGQTLCFCHGFSVLYGQIQPPKDVNTVLFVPNAPGRFVREKYCKCECVYGCVAVDHNATGDAEKIALAISKAVGSTRAGVVLMSFQHETEGIDALMTTVTARIGAVLLRQLPHRQRVGRLFFRQPRHVLRRFVERVVAGGQTASRDARQERDLLQQLGSGGRPNTAQRLETGRSEKRGATATPREGHSHQHVTLWYGNETGRLRGRAGHLGHGQEAHVRPSAGHGQRVPREIDRLDLVAGPVRSHQPQVADSRFSELWIFLGFRQVDQGSRRPHRD